MKRMFSVVCFLLMFSFGVKPSFAGEPHVVYSAVVDLGEDVGQNFGSIFEARDSDGRVVAGAGFMEVYNTRFRGDRHTLQFFVKPEKGANDFAVERLPHPDLDCGIYLIDFNQRLFAWTRARGDRVRAWDAAAGKWRETIPPASGQVDGGGGIMRIGGGTLVFSGGRATWFDSPKLAAPTERGVPLTPAGEGQVILEAPSEGRYYNFYYAHGRLCFYHTHRAGGGGFTKLYACAWTPKSKKPIDVSAAPSIDTKYLGATPFAWGQFQDEVLTVSNYGGVYVFNGSGWRTIKEANDKVSYQVYSMLNYHDRLLLSQYPTGELFEYDGKEIRHLKGWPPRLPGVSPSAREAQTTAIYGGELYVGVWPWAEVWRYDRDAGKWHSLGRMFTHPEISDKTVHPYEAEANKHNLVTNHWGQRVTGMLPLGDALMLSTSTKGTSEWSDEYTFLTEKQRREYGAVLRLKRPGNLAAQIEWKSGPTKLEFVVESDRMSIRQDGKELASAKLPGASGGRLKGAKVQWGRGVFGDLNGKVSQPAVR